MKVRGWKKVFHATEVESKPDSNIWFKQNRLQDCYKRQRHYIMMKGSIQQDITVVDRCTQLQFSSVTQSCPTLCDLMDCSTPEFTQTHLQ